MLKVWATLASAVFVSAAFGQSVELEAVAPMPSPAPYQECAPPCLPCWHLNLSIPKHPLRTWLGSCEAVQKCAAYWTYYPPHCGHGGCCPKPDPLVPPPLYTYFWPVHCINGDCGSCCSPHGVWNGTGPAVDEGFASAGVPVGTVQYSHARQADQDQRRYKSMLTFWRKDKAPAATNAIVPVSGNAASGKR